MVSGIVSQACHNYFSAFSDLPLKSKIVRVALPTIVGLAVLGTGIALAYYLWSPAKLKPKDFEDAEIGPLMLSEIQLNEATPKAVRDHKTQAYQLVLDEIFPLSVTHPYIIAQTAATSVQCNSFYRLAGEEAGLIISIGSSENFNFFKEGSMTAGPYLECISGPKEVSARCTSYQFNFKTLPSSASDSQKNNKTLWHLNINLSSKENWLKDLHHALDVIDEFIDQNKISFENRSLIVTSRPRDDQAGIFIIFHQLYHHCKKLVEKELKDNPNMKDEEVADKILKDIDVTQLIEQRSRLIKKLSRNKFGIENPLVDHTAYRNIVLLNMIGKMRGSSKAPVPPSATSPELKAAEVLNQLPDLDELVKVDAIQTWESWNKFIPHLTECETNLRRTLSISGIDAKMKIWEYIDAHTSSLTSCQNFYQAMEKAIEPDVIPSYEKTTCHLFRDLMKQKLEQQGYTLCSIPNKSGEYKLQGLSLTLFDVLVQWYRKDTQNAEKADRLGNIVEELKARQKIEPGVSVQLNELLKPLRDLSGGVINDQQFNLLKMIMSVFENEPKIAIKAYLKFVLAGTNYYYTNLLFQGVTNLEGPVFFLLGECLTTTNHVYEWLKVLYKGPIEDGSNILSPGLYAKVKDFLIQILSNEEYLNDLYRGPEGRIALSCMWLQVEEEILFKAVPTLFKEGNNIDQFIVYSDLPSIWERFASDPIRIEHHPEPCDLLLECAFKVQYRNVKPLELLNWLKTSQWAHLQRNKKLPRLSAAYRQRVPADS